MEYAIFVRVCLADACGRSPTETKCFSHAQTVHEFVLCPFWSFCFSFYKRMGLMVAILPTHPRVGEVTCMRADAKRQQDLTGTHAQTVFEKMLSKKIASKKEYLWPYGSMCSQSLRFFVKSCARVLMLSRNGALRNFFHTRANRFSLC